MTTKKHLVLDHDVHLRLLRRKKQLGLPIKAIGNSILRICLDKSAPMFELLRDELVGMGKITAEDFNDAVERAMQTSSQIYTTDDGFLSSIEDGVTACGSWNVECIYDPSPGRFRIYSFSTRNLRGHMTPSHFHKQDLHVLVMSGVVAFHIGAEQHQLSANSGIHIPAGQTHSKVPLSADARMLVALVDPETDAGTAASMLTRVTTT